MNKLMLVSEFQRLRFKGGKKPSTRTIRRWIIAGVLPGERIGGRYFVDITQLERTAAEEERQRAEFIDRVLKGLPRKKRSKRAC